MKFVIGIIENAPMFLVALVIGAVITMAGIVLLKKPLNTEKNELLLVKKVLNIIESKMRKGD